MSIRHYPYHCMFSFISLCCLFCVRAGVTVQWGFSTSFCDAALCCFSFRNICSVHPWFTPSLVSNEYLWTHYSFLWYSWCLSQSCFPRQLLIFTHHLHYLGSQDDVTHSYMYQEELDDVIMCIVLVWRFLLFCATSTHATRFSHSRMGRLWFYLQIKPSLTFCTLTTCAQNQN